MDPTRTVEYIEVGGEIDAVEIGVFQKRGAEPHHAVTWHSTHHWPLPQQNSSADLIIRSRGWAMAGLAAFLRSYGTVAHVYGSVVRLPQNCMHGRIGNWMVYMAEAGLIPRITRLLPAYEVRALAPSLRLPPSQKNTSPLVVPSSHSPVLRLWRFVHTGQGRGSIRRRHFSLIAPSHMARV